MKVLVAVKRVVDANVQIQIKSDKSAIDISNAKMSINPFCEIAVEEAICLKEACVAEEVIVVSVGEDVCQEQLKMALALGADRAIQIKTSVELQPLSVAKLLQKIVVSESVDLVILGKQSIDGDNNQTGQMLAAIAGMSQGTFASNVGIGNGEAIVTREIDGGLQTIGLKLPAVITADLRLNEPRFASLPNIMKAKRKPLVQITPEELGVDVAPRLTTLEINTPPTRSVGHRVANVVELVEKLKVGGVL